MREYPLAESECEDMGGHCYERHNEILLSMPPKQKRTCKHCGHTQIGERQVPMKWHDAR